MKSSLLREYPEIAAQWSPRNVMPVEKATSKSSTTYWWVCSQDHEWKTSIASRTQRNTECPYCTGKKAIVGVNDFKTLYPQAAAQWSPKNPGNPEDYLPFSKKKMLWECDYKHEWEATIAKRSEGRGCPICSGQKVFPGFNDLVTTHPDIAAEISSRSKVRPEEVTAGSGKKALWECKANHEWESSIYSRTRTNPAGCEECARENMVNTSAIEQEYMNLIEELMEPKGWTREDARAFTTLVEGEHRFRTIDGLYTYGDKTIFVEYDGYFWHESETLQDRDKRKNKLILDSSDDHVVIRIRDKRLPFLDMKHPNLYQVKSTKESVKTLCSYITATLDGKIGV